MVGGVGLTRKWSTESVWISDLDWAWEEEEVVGGEVVEEVVEEHERKRGFRVMFYGRREIGEDTLLDEVPVLQFDSSRSSSPLRAYISRFEID